MNITYESQGTMTYGVYQIQPNDVLDTLGLGMLTNNKIPGLAATQFTQMDNQRYIKFNVTAKVPVSQFFTGQVNRKRLLGVFRGIVAGLLSAEEYMIDPNSILLDLDHIYTDVTTVETVLICLPIQQDKPPVDLGRFFKNIMFSTQFDQTENCDYVARIMNYLNSTPNFSLQDFNELTIQLEREGAGRPAAAPARPAPAQQPMQAAPIQQPQMQQPARPMQSQQPIQPQQPIPQPGYQPRMAQPQSIPQPSVPGAQPNPAMRQNPPQQPAFQIPGQQPPQQPAFQIPGQQPPQQPPVQNPGGKKMTFMNLMMHYSKENAALYKAQKEAGQAAAQMPAAPEPPKKDKKSKKKKDAAPQGFTVPGAPTGGFAIPGQTPPPIRPAAPASSYAPVSAPAAPAPAAPRPQVYQPQAAAPMGQPMNFGETTVLGGAGGAIGETTVLGASSAKAAPQPRPMLLRLKNNERINIDKPVYRIGKERSYVNYFIGDNSAISRSHANIITRDGKYFVMDTNSTNHTFVNGSMIQSNVEVPLEHGTMLRLADEEFEFKLF